MSQTLETQPVSKPSAFEPATMDDAMKLAAYLAKSNIVPKDFQGKPENVFIAIVMGREVGLKPMAALQNIMVVNGRPSLWGDAVWALIKNNVTPEGLVEYARETLIETDPRNPVAVCEIKMKRDEKPVLRTFSQADAIKAGLWGKPGPWSGYPKRMLQMRARAFAARDAAPDLLKGLAVVEEMADVTPLAEAKPEIKMPEPVKINQDAPAASQDAPGSPQIVAPASAPLETGKQAVPAESPEPELPEATPQVIQAMLNTQEGRRLTKIAEEKGLPASEFAAYLSLLSRKCPPLDFWNKKLPEIEAYVNGGFNEPDL